MARHACIVSTLAEATNESTMSGINGEDVVVAAQAELLCMRGYGGTVVALLRCRGMAAGLDSSSNRARV